MGMMDNLVSQGKKYLWHGTNAAFDTFDDPTALLAPGGLLGNLGGESISALLKYFTGK